MQIVIELNEHDIEWIKNGYSIPNELNLAITEAILNGTVLSEPHGELVDIRPLMRGLYEEMCVGELNYITSEVRKMIEEETNIILKATKESADANSN